jgi:hypothetical protein
MDRKWLENLSQEQLIDLILKKDESERKCRGELRWVHQLMSNTTASGDEKEAAYWVRFRSRGNEPREDGLFHIYNSDIVKDSGLNDDKLGKILKKFEERGVIKRKLEYQTDEKTGKPQRLNWMALDQSVLANPRAIDFGKNTKHGGDRKPRCANCGSEKMKVETKKRVTCCECGLCDEDKDWTLRRGCDYDLDLDPDEEVF